MSALGDYYRAQTQEAGARTAATYAQAQLTGQQVGQVAPNADATRALQEAQAKQATAGAAQTTAATGQLALNGVASRALDNSRTDQNNTNTGLATGIATADNAYKNALAGVSRQAVQIGAGNVPGANPGVFGGGLPTLPSIGGMVPSDVPVGVPLANTGKDPNAQGFAKGGTVKAEKVQGKGKPGPTDTVPTALTPGEAVLNKGAVGHYGTDVIDHMNKMGLMRMAAESEVAKAAGAPDPHAAPAAGAGGKSGAKGAKGGGDAKAASTATAMRGLANHPAGRIPQVPFLASGGGMPAG